MWGLAYKLFTSNWVECKCCNPAVFGSTHYSAKNEHVKFKSSLNMSKNYHQVWCIYKVFFAIYQLLFYSTLLNSLLITCSFPRVQHYAENCIQTFISKFLFHTLGQYIPNTHRVSNLKCPSSYIIPKLYVYKSLSVSLTHLR